MRCCLGDCVQGAAELDTPRVLSAASQLSLWFKAHMPDILTAAPQGQSSLCPDLACLPFMHPLFSTFMQLPPDFNEMILHMAKRPGVVVISKPGFDHRHHDSQPWSVLWMQLSALARAYVSC